MRRLVLVLLACSACAGAKWSSSTTGLDGKTTTKFSDAEDQKRHDDQEQAKADHAAAIAAAPRRAPTDVIEVAVFDATVAADLEKALDAKKLQQSLLAELQKDPLLRVKAVGGLKDSFGRTPTGLDDAVEAARARGVRPDVWVFPHVLLEDAIGKSGGKLVATKAFTLKSEVVSAWATGRADPKARGGIFQNQQVVKDAATGIRAAVVKDLGPGLPSRPAVAKLEGDAQAKAVADLQAQAGIQPEDDAATRLKKLWNAQTQQKKK